MPIDERKCRQCGERYEIMERGDERWAYSRPVDELDDLSCTGCGADDYDSVGMGTGILLGGEAGVGKHFPYFDNALGLEVQSSTHRDFLMDHYSDGTPRDIPLQPTEGGEDFAGWAAAERYQAEEDEKVYNEVMAEQTEGPNKEANAKMQQALADGWMPPALEEASDAPPEIVSPAPPATPTPTPTPPTEAACPE